MLHLTTWPNDSNWEKFPGWIRQPLGWCTGTNLKLMGSTGFVALCNWSLLGFVTCLNWSLKVCHLKQGLSPYGVNCFLWSLICRNVHYNHTCRLLECTLCALVLNFLNVILRRTSSDLNCNNNRLAAKTLKSSKFFAFFPGPEDKVCRPVKSSLGCISSYSYYLQVSANKRTTLCSNYHPLFNSLFTAEMWYYFTHHSCVHIWK